MNAGNFNVSGVRSLLVAGLLAAGLCTQAAAADSRKKVSRKAVTQQLCSTAEGALVARQRCNVNGGEVRLDTLGLSALANSALVGLPAGTTFSSVFGGEFSSTAGGAWAVAASWPFTTPAPLTPNDIIVAVTPALSAACGGDVSTCLDNAQVQAAAQCTGSVSAPTAPAGKLCVYPETITNASGITVTALPADSADKGFLARWTAVNQGQTAMIGVWAYTAPGTAAQTGPCVAGQTSPTCPTPTPAAQTSPTVTPTATPTPASQVSPTATPTEQPTVTPTPESQVSPTATPTGKPVKKPKKPKRPNGTSTEN